MSDLLQGIIHGKTVKLVCDPGLEQGQRVEVVLRPVTNDETPICSAAGMLADMTGLDESLQDIHQLRKIAQYRTDSL